MYSPKPNSQPHTTDKHQYPHNAQSFQAMSALPCQYVFLHKEAGAFLNISLPKNSLIFEKIQGKKGRGLIVTLTFYKYGAIL
jgi:hypothetical protein